MFSFLAIHAPVTPLLNNILTDFALSSDVVVLGGPFILGILGTISVFKLFLCFWIQPWHNRIHMNIRCKFLVMKEG